MSTLISGPLPCKWVRFLVRSGRGLILEFWLGWFSHSSLSHRPQYHKLHLSTRNPTATFKKTSKSGFKPTNTAICTEFLLCSADVSFAGSFIALVINDWLTNPSGWSSILYSKSGRIGSAKDKSHYILYFVICKLCERFVPWSSNVQNCHVDQCNIFGSSLIDYLLLALWLLTMILVSHHHWTESLGKKWIIYKAFASWVFFWYSSSFWVHRLEQQWSNSRLLCWNSDPDPKVPSPLVKISQNIMFGGRIGICFINTLHNSLLLPITDSIIESTANARNTMNIVRYGCDFASNRLSVSSSLLLVSGSL